MLKARLAPRFEVWLEAGGRRIAGKQETQILEGIQKLGSFIATARALGISYAHAWNTIDHIRENIGEPVVEARKGGKFGGGAKLTETGLEILKRYWELEAHVRASLSGPSTPQTGQAAFSLELKPLDFAVIGSDCVGIDILIEMMLRKRGGFSYEVARVGSSGGLAAIMLGEADVAGIHLLDEETGQYNTPFLKRYWIADRAVLIRGYLREVGLIVAKGNPKRIYDINDLLRTDVKFINRTLGSGTRTFLDAYLKMEIERRGLRFKETVAKVKGYSVEVKSHREVAEAVLRSEADAGLGIGAVAHNYGLGFIPVARENFDFVVEEKRLRKPLVKQFLEGLVSKEFEMQVRALGLHITKETGKVL